MIARGKGEIVYTSTSISHDYITIELTIAHKEYTNTDSLVNSMYQNFLCTLPKSFRLKLAKLILAKDTQTNEQFY